MTKGNLSHLWPGVSLALTSALAFGASTPLLATMGVAWLALLSAAAVVGFVSIGVSLVLFILGLRHLGAARTGAYFSLAPSSVILSRDRHFRYPAVEAFGLRVLSAGEYLGERRTTGLNDRRP